MRFGVKQIFKMLCQHIIFPFCYTINRWRKPEDELVVLADAHHDACPPHMEQLREKLAQEHYHVEEYFCDISKCGTWEGFRFMTRFMKLYSQASYVFICDNFLPVASCRKKKETKVVQLWHGCGAFKKFGYDAKDDIPAGYHGDVYRNYDLVTVSGDGCVEHFISAMGINRKNGKKDKNPKQLSIVRPLGVSHTDRLFDEDYLEACRDKFRYAYPDAAGKTVLLWAPTFRGNAAQAELVGQDYIDALQESPELADRIYVIKSLHPHLHDGLPEDSGEKQDAACMTTDELMVCADILITDYSSVFFEYLLFDRPIIFFAPDYRAYGKSRGFYQEYDSLPGYVVKGSGHDVKRKEMNIFMQEELRSAVKMALQGDTEDMRHMRGRYKSLYMNACDGTATERLIRNVFEQDDIG